MTIDLVTGPLGTGKSYFMVRKGVEYLLDGKIAIFNFELAPDFAERVAYRSIGHEAWWITSRRVRKCESIASRVYEVPGLPELMRLRIRKEDPWVRVNGYGKTVLREGIAFLGLDEAHKWMNARLWTDGDRGKVVAFFALGRKHGFHTYLGTQRAQNMDVQVRELFEDHIRLNNLKRSARIAGIPVIPWNWFVALRTSHHYPGEIAGRDVYLLNWCKDLYDTMDTASFGEEEEPEGGSILLPQWTKPPEAGWSERDPPSHEGEAPPFAAAPRLVGAGTAPPPLRRVEDAIAEGVDPATFDPAA